MLLAGQSKDFSGLSWLAFLPCLSSNDTSFGILLQNIHSESLSFAEEKKKKKKEDEAAAVSTVMVRLTHSIRTWAAVAGSHFKACGTWWLLICLITRQFLIWAFK